MTTRRISLNTPVIPDPQRIAWIEANGLNPNTIVADQEVIVEDGKLTFVEFLFNENGGKVLNTDGTGCVKRTRTVDLVSAPEDHGL